ncbi:MAG TPA: F0F1 ATP synthase subunit delta [Candidatus Saccharimonadales bacterium]|nr:F0F1 ATP synthase subunit delta [Candidatus Saccharimonadales bacterium]
MKTPRTQIAKTLADKALKAGSSKQLAKEAAAYLLEEGRVSELDSILRDIQDNWASAGYVEVIARSAHSLTPSVKADITKQIKQLYPSAKRIVINAVEDAEVIGGVRLELANQQLDLSVEAKLNRFKQLTRAGKDN